MIVRIITLQITVLVDPEAGYMLPKEFVYIFFRPMAIVGDAIAVTLAHPVAKFNELNLIKRNSNE